MYLRKARGGSGAAGHYWEHDGDVAEVPDHLALELLDVPGHDYTLVEPEDLDPADDADVEGDEEPSAERPKRQYRRRAAADQTEVAE
jgi:hypothetical protein